MTYPFRELFQRNPRGRCEGKDVTVCISSGWREKGIAMETHKSLGTIFKKCTGSQPSDARFFLFVDCSRLVPEIMLLPGRINFAYNHIVAIDRPISSAK
ncbi:MAG: hypothetical protein CVU46_00935 [Chloroflexi bacterium HGW-Chloroflexi-8]|nr:MAG: hypothetical protein CVU46_00935 [Chloroflexi bacterium HGW-Chloroflexi-8]